MNPTDNISDIDLYEAIENAPTWKYLDDLKKHVGKHFNIDPTLFGMRIYYANQNIEQARQQKRIADMGFIIINDKNFEQYVDKPSECLVSTGLMGDTIVEGKVKIDKNDGSFWFCPKGKRKNGYRPRYIRLIK